MSKVVILQHRLLHYRLGFFDRLRARCMETGIDLRLVHGQPTPREAQRNDTGRLSWAQSVTNKVVSSRSLDVIWQPFPEELCDADMLILMQENRIVSNYPWLFRFNRHRPILAFWGHGRNLQSRAPRGLRERWKRFVSRRVDWWFAYTERTRDILSSDGYPAERVTVVDNSIDTSAFKLDLASVSAERLRQICLELGIGADALVGIFCGSLYKDKELGLLIQAVDMVKARCPSFVLIVIGDGAASDEIQAASEARDWIKWVGSKRGVEKAAYFKLAKVMLNPGAVGLHILDAFCAGIPMITTVGAFHGPEIAYLENGKNGLVSEGNPLSFSDSVVSILCDEDSYQHLVVGAKKGAERYTLDNMVERFYSGIICALGQRASPRSGHGIRTDA